MGLLHPARIDDSCISVVISSEAGRPCKIDLDVRWCRPCGHGWYLSGGRFAELGGRNSQKLRLASLAAEANRRLKQRYPFFRPVSIESTNVTSNVLAFTRDISPEGIGLLHNVPVEPETGLLRVAENQNGDAILSVEFTWCSPCNNGWFVSGGRFRKLDLEQLPDLRF